MIDHLDLKAYAKINLALDVTGVRDDGYHEVRMIMQTVGIFDRVVISRSSDKGITVGSNLYFLPNDKNNLAYKAAKLLADEFDIREGISIKLHKYIPVSAGLAGGSSDAAAVLFGINKMFGLGLDTGQLIERGSKIGADVPFCIVRGTVLARGIGEILTPLPKIPQCKVLIAKPGINLSTKFIYDNLDLDGLKADDHPDIDGMTDAIKEGDIFKVASFLGNVLEKVAIPHYPVIGTLKDIMREYGAIGTLMSGSGPTVFGLFKDNSAAEAAYENLRYKCDDEIAKQVYLTDFYNPVCQEG